MLGFIYHHTAGIEFSIGFSWIHLLGLNVAESLNGRHDTLANAASRNSDIPALPSTWMVLMTTSDYRAKLLLLYYTCCLINI